MHLRRWYLHAAQAWFWPPLPAAAGERMEEEEEEDGWWWWVTADEEAVVIWRSRGGGGVEEEEVIAGVAGEVGGVGVVVGIGKLGRGGEEEEEAGLPTRPYSAAICLIKGSLVQTNFIHANETISPCMQRRENIHGKRKKEEEEGNFEEDAEWVVHMRCVSDKLAVS